MLTDQIVADQAGQSNSNDFMFSSELEYNGYAKNPSHEDLVETYQVPLNMRIVLLFYLIGLGTVCVSTLIPILYTTRLNPKKILM